MSVDVEELLRETPAPPMSLSPASVLGAAKQDVVRRRRRFAGLATAGVAAAAAVAITVGVVRGSESTSRPIPANTPTQSIDTNPRDQIKQSFFSNSNGLPVGQVRSSAIPVTSGDTNNNEMTSETVYAVSTLDGVLRLSRVEGTRQVLLPLVAKLAGGGSMTTDRQQSLVVRPLPLDVRVAYEVFGDGGFSDGGGLTMPDGSKAGVFWLGTTVPVSDAGFAWWRTTSGHLASSTGENAKTVTLSAGDRKATYWEFTKNGYCGFDEGTGGSATAMTDGQCPTNLSAADDQAEWTQTVDGPISKLHGVPAPDVTDPMLVSATIPGTSRVVLWGLGTLASGSSAGSDAPFSKVTWTGPDGKAHSWDASTP